MAKKVKHNGKWIKAAIKRPGALHRALKVPEGEKIPAKKMAAARKKAKKNPSGKLAKMVRLARTLGKMRKK